MSYYQRLDRSFQHVPILPWDDDSRYVLFSDCHRGNGSRGDNFLKNRHLFLAALDYYYRGGFTYIELGDGDELWENRSIKQIKELHGEVFRKLSQFYKANRLYMLYGNHDMMKKYPSYAKKKCATYYCTLEGCTQPLFPGISFHSGLILQNPRTGNRLYLTHGHQASLLNSTLWPINCLLVRHLWKPLEQIGILDSTSAAKNHKTKKRTEKRLSSWANHHHRTLITGHTHRPMLPSEEGTYANTGSCVHLYCITCIEIRGENRFLVKWYVGTKPSGCLYVERELLA